MTSHKSLFLMRIVAMLLLACAIAGCQSAEETPLPDPPPLILDGYETAVVEQIQAAHMQWEATPLSSRANGDLAMLFHTYLQYSVATVYYQRARLLDPGEFRWAYLSALVLYKLGEREQLIATLRHALTLDNSYAPATLQLAVSLAEAGQDDESRLLYNELLRQHPELPQALYGLGILLVQQEDESGLALLQRAINRKGPYGAAHYALAEVYRNQGETDKADEQLKLFQKYRTVEPALSDTLFTEMQNMNVSKQGLINRGQRMIAQGRVREAIEQFEEALVRDSSMAGAHSLLISAYGMLGKYDQAELHYHQGVALNPNLVRAHNNFGVLRLKQGRYDDAVQAFRNAIAVDPDYIDAYVNLGVALETSGKRSEAIRHYNTAVERDPLHRQAGFYLGNAYMKMSNPHRAAEQFLRILKPEDRATPEYLQALAIAYVEMWNHDDAEATLQLAITVAGNTGRTDLLPKLRAALRRLEVAKKPSIIQTPQ